jgi:hypothetical protein
MRATLLMEFPGPTDLAEVQYVPNILKVSIDPSIRLTFNDVYGLRILDEHDLLEFWPTCSAQNGGLFEILDGGWLAQENTRNSFLTGNMMPQLKEYLVTGPNDCLNIFSLGPPEVSSGV